MNWYLTVSIYVKECLFGYLCSFLSYTRPLIKKIGLSLHEWLAFFEMSFAVWDYLIIYDLVA